MVIIENQNNLFKSITTVKKLKAMGMFQVGKLIALLHI